MVRWVVVTICVRGPGLKGGVCSALKFQRVLCAWPLRALAVADEWGYLWIRLRVRFEPIYRRREAGYPQCASQCYIVHLPVCEIQRIKEADQKESKVVCQTTFHSQIITVCHTILLLMIVHAWFRLRVSNSSNSSKRP